MEADIFITNYRLDGFRLKIDYETMKAINPKLIYALATGYGEKGKKKTNQDTVLLVTGPDRLSRITFSRMRVGLQLPLWRRGSPKGMTLFASIMSGLYKRQKTGEGCKVFTSLLANGAWSNSVMLQAQLSNAEFREKRPRERAYNFSSLN